MAKAFSAFFVVAALLPGLAGAAENSDKSGEASPAGIEVTTSFISSCRNTNVYYGHDGAVIEANADSCRKRNGSWGGYTSFSGYCTGDVSNNDGNIFCRNVAGDVQTEQVSRTGADTTEVTASFLFSCEGGRYTQASSGHIISAIASYCTRRNGTRNYAPSWSGDCWGDVSNDDGNIVCYNR